jgi:uncharacterized RDD family membrane protein YckC
VDEPLDPHAGRATQFPTEPGQFPPSGPNSLASIGQRFVARLVDGVVLLGPFFLLVAAFGTEEVIEDASSLPFIAFLVVGVLYEALLVAWRGQTVGKATLGIRVARLADGEVPTLTQASIRVLFPTAVSAVPVVGALSIVIYLMAWASPIRQGWHDRAAGTVVVRVR